MISNISTRPKTYPPKLNANDLFKSYQFFIKLIIMDELETSLEQNALISNLISLRNTQQLTSIIATPILLS
ncbi:ABC transporter, ATP-binding protein [Helicobacter pylori NQ4099]|uniref:ABC transporter, ATP-binding protein n=2 Tax=Helicobacter pylori TaxID=210 RepID=J0IY92_HELPX|nr:ABC transporter, ATP-binding protein [Helicobacter pylori NQ4099]EJB34439.1 ABC transporter, ATP-binding protein [Helicobacter pylori NQ4076]